MFIPEGEVVFDALINSTDDTLPNLSRERTAIFESFLEKPLSDMQAKSRYELKEVFIKAIKEIVNIKEAIFDE